MDLSTQLFRIFLTKASPKRGCGYSTFNFCSCTSLDLLQGNTSTLTYSILKLRKFIVFLNLENYVLFKKIIGSREKEYDAIKKTLTIPLK